ncbi:hypothetical protein ACIQWA_16415 [Kitasatospora sp. NPDC098652]|uniref:hypothetical protein n=1 Tax=Kitasatospora sp. NPDC098652 TaxID=3364095 RepID=UPI003812219B
MAEGKWLRQRWLAAGGAAVLLAGAGFGLWWRSAHAPAELPVGACWSVLTRADLKPLAEGEHGTFVEHYGLDYGERLRPTGNGQSCEVRRGLEAPLVQINVWLMDEFAMNAVYGAGAKESKSRLDFGVDVQGWVGPVDVGLGLRCDNPETTRLGEPYVGVQVFTRDNTPKSARSHRAVLDIALKTAKAVVASYPCSNPVHLPDSVPETAANIPSHAP